MQVNMQLPRQAKEGGKHLLVGVRQWYLAAIVWHGNSMDMPWDVIACAASKIASQGQSQWVVGVGGGGGVGWGGGGVRGGGGGVWIPNPHESESVFV